MCPFQKLVHFPTDRLFDHKALIGSLKARCVCEPGLALRQSDYLNWEIGTVVDEAIHASITKKWNGIFLFNKPRIGVHLDRSQVHLLRFIFRLQVGSLTV